MGERAGAAGNAPARPAARGDASAGAATAPAPLAAPGAPAQWAKGALRRLAADRLEPTPDNYARAYRFEAGEEVGPGMGASADGDARADGERLATLIERTVKGLERGSRQWTAARKKESLQRVLANSRSDARRLQQRVSQLVASWDGDEPDPFADAAGAADASASASAEPVVGASLDTAAIAAAAVTTPSAAVVAAIACAPPPIDVSGIAAASHSSLAPAWPRIVSSLGGTVGVALPAPPGQRHELAGALDGLAAQLDAEGASAPLATQIEQVCARAERVLQQRHRLVGQLGDLCHELTASLTDLAENDTWAQGQCEAMRMRIDEGLTSRGVRSVAELLRTTRERHGRLRTEREQARDALKGLIHRMLSELDELGSQTGSFHESVGRYAEVIGRADSIETLAGVVREMVEESRSVESLVRQTQARLAGEHRRAGELTQRVGELEAEMKRLSDEVATDPLTQVANRRGLLQRFDAERAHADGNASPLAVGLLDIDNFKRLNDELGHGAGDAALVSLAARVRAALRPADHVARYGGEEFVVLLPATEVIEAGRILTRLQRSLTGGLFMHEERQVFVTFSAGVTAYRRAERIEDALERADQALYEAKRTGKNRTCVG